MPKVNPRNARSGKRAAGQDEQTDGDRLATSGAIARDEGTLKAIRDLLPDDQSDDTAGKTAAGPAGAGVEQRQRRRF